MVHVPESSQSDNSLLRINIKSGNNVSLLTNCQLHTAKYSDRSFNDGPNEMRSLQKILAPDIFRMEGTIG